MRNPAKTRTCAGCGKKTDKANLIRIGKDSGGSISITEFGGRGAYICKNRACLERAVKKKRSSMILKTPVNQDILSQLSDILGSDSN